MKKFLNKSKNKKGFTMVELIVVIVIILVLAAVLVPSLLKYIDQANRANCKADAATMLSQIQADYAASQTGAEMGTITVAASYSGVSVTKSTTEIVASTNYDAAIKAEYYVNDKNEISSFAYGNGKHTAVWNQGTTAEGSTSGGWTVN